MEKKDISKDKKSTTKKSTDEKKITPESSEHIDEPIIQEDETPEEPMVQNVSEPITPSIQPTSNVIGGGSETLSQPTTPLGFSDDYDDDIPLEKKNKKLFIIGAIVLVMILAVTGWLLYSRVNQNPESEETTAVEVDGAEEEEVVEEETKVEQLTREEITIEVLNGTGETGLAGSTADTFEELGYIIGDTGNADDTEGNQLYVDPEIKDAVEVLLKDVKDELGITKITGDLEDSEYSAQIILGTKVVDEEEEKPTPTEEVAEGE